MKIETRIETAGKKFNLYYPNVHPKTGEITENIFKEKTLKEIKDFADRRALDEVSGLIKQITRSKTQEKRAKKQTADAAELENWRQGRWFGKGAELRLSNSGKNWSKRQRSTFDCSSPDRIYFGQQITEQIFNEIGIENPGFDLFYDCEKKCWSAKKLSAKHAKKLNQFLK